jgi:hypothetical protein
VTPPLCYGIGFGSSLSTFYDGAAEKIHFLDSTTNTHCTAAGGAGGAAGYWVEEGEDAGSFLEGYLAGLQEMGEMKLTPGESREGQKDGHTMALRLSEAALAEGTLPIVSGAWICDASGRAFAVTYLTTEERTPDELQAALERYLEGLACH